MISQTESDEAVDALRRQGLSIDGDNAYKRDLIDCIHGAIAFGLLNANPPPPGHWCQPFWDAGRQFASRKSDLMAENADLSARQQAPEVGTTSDKYRAELYDEVWQRARDMGYGNVTEALIALERQQAPAEQENIEIPRVIRYDDSVKHGYRAPDSVAPAEHAAEAVAVLPPFAEKVIAKLRRVEECFTDGQGADIGTHWFDILTKLGLLNREQRSPALWSISQQGEDVLSAKPYAAPVDQSELPPIDEHLIDILGRPNFACSPIAHALRAAGFDIQRKSEDEQAVVIHWMLGFYMKHRSNWRAEAESALKAYRAALAKHEKPSHD